MSGDPEVLGAAALDIASRMEARVIADDPPDFGVMQSWIGTLRSAVRLDTARDSRPVGEATMAGEGGAIPAAAGAAQTASAPATTLERARVLIESIRAASDELTSLYGSLWHESRVPAGPAAVRPVEREGAEAALLAFVHAYANTEGKDGDGVEVALFEAWLRATTALGLEPTPPVREDRHRTVGDPR